MLPKQPIVTATIQYCSNCSQCYHTRPSLWLQFLFTAIELTHTHTHTIELNSAFARFSCRMRFTLTEFSPVIVSMPFALIENYLWTALESHAKEHFSSYPTKYSKAVRVTFWNGLWMAYSIWHLIVVSSTQFVMVGSLSPSRSNVIYIFSINNLIQSRFLQLCLANREHFYLWFYVNTRYTHTHSDQLPSLYVQYIQSQQAVQIVAYTVHARSEKTLSWHRAQHFISIHRHSSPFYPLLLSSNNKLCTSTRSHPPPPPPLIAVAARNFAFKN